MPTVEILGVHPLLVAQELFEQALADKYGQEFRQPMPTPERLSKLMNYLPVD